MAHIAKKDDLYEDFLSVPSHMVAEILNGNLVTHPRPSPKHAFAYSNLGYEIIGPYQKGKGGPGGWIIIDEPELHLDENIMVPDLAGWRKDRMPKLPETAWFETVPDWVCEILSPSTAQYDKGLKRDLYGEKGVEYLWFIDPVIQILEAFHFENGRWILLNTVTGGDLVAVDPFSKAPFALSNLWYQDDEPA